MKITNIAQLLLGLILALSMTGCANKSMENAESGFLTTYDDITTHEQFSGTRVAITANVDFTQYDNIYIAPVKVLSPIPTAEQTAEQQKLCDEISQYLTAGYKESIQTNTRYTLVDSPNTPKTVVFEGAISAVEVHYEDMGPMNVMPMMLVFTALSRTAQDAAVRVLGEGRLSDPATDTVLIRMVRLSKGREVQKEAGELVFNDVKPALDDWLKDTTSNLVKLRKGLIKEQPAP